MIGCLGLVTPSAASPTFSRRLHGWFGVWIRKCVYTYLYIPASRVCFRWVCPSTAGGRGGHGGWGMHHGPRLWSKFCVATTTSPRSHTLARGALIAMKCGMYEFWSGEGKAGIWVEHSGDTNHQAHIQHAHSICIACIVGYQCYPKAFHNLYRHTQNTNRAPHPPP